jgi:hypothetical protein
MLNGTQVGMDDHNQFHIIFKDSSIDMQDRNILLFVDNCATYSDDTSFLWNVTFDYYPPNFMSVMPSTRTGCG